jgi:uncharacterized protein (DUF1330 family)
MKTHYTVALAMLAGFGLGAVAVQGLHAQAKPPVYSVAEIDIADQAAYATYVPKAQAAIKAAGGKILAAGGVTTIEGEPPKPRAVIQQWDSLEKFQAYRGSVAFKDLLPIREKVAKFRSFVVEGVPQKPGRISFRGAHALGRGTEALRAARRPADESRIRGLIVPADGGM